VLGLVAKGMSNREIAAALSLSEKTVVMYVSHVFVKLGVKNRTEAVAAAVERGILER
jgi:DNA-binding NarL/FixJ family response regulator